MNDTPTAAAPLTEADLDEMQRIVDNAGHLFFDQVDGLIALARAGLAATALREAAEMLLLELKDAHWSLYENPEQCGGCYAAWPCETGLLMRDLAAALRDTEKA